jgi:DNA-binding IclR family transcriptional regulator
MAPTSDAGSLKRGVLLLKLLATAGSRGLPLSEIAAKSGMPHPTAHRVLRQLGVERLIERHEELKRYRLGPLAFELGVAGSPMYDIRDLCDESMDVLSIASEDTVYLVVRSGFDAVCMHRREGSFPIRTLVLEVGSRRPLGVGAGGLAILSAIDPTERAEIIERVAPAVSVYGLSSPSALSDACERTRSDGLALIQNTINFGVTAVGQPFRDAMGQPVGALSVAALSQRMTAKRIRQISELLREACKSVEKRLRSKRRSGWQAG